MTNIKVGFSKPKKWKPFSWLIMKGYGTPYSHSYIKFRSNTYDCNLIYQASHSLVNFTAESVFEDENEVIKEFDLDISDETRINMIKFAINNSGKPYGIKEVFGLAIVRICEIFGKKIKNPFGFKNFVCSMLVAFILEECLKLDIPGEFQESTPKILYDYMLSLAIK